MGAETHPERIVLVGFMGSGKTTVGAALARLLGWEFVDLDRTIEERSGRSVAEIFREGGEALFREEEKRAALELAGSARHVVAAGGGAFAVPETREALRRGAVTVWLSCDLRTMLARVGPGVDRPLASNRETMRRRLEAREPSYRLADIVVETSRVSPEEAARRIREAIFGREGRPGGPPGR